MLLFASSAESMRTLMVVACPLLLHHGMVGKNMGKNMSSF